MKGFFTKLKVIVKGNFILMITMVLIYVVLKGCFCERIY